MKILLCSILAFFIFSCQSEIDLDKLEKHELSFHELPDELKPIYSSQKIVANDTFDYEVISLDSNIVVTHKWSGLNKQILTEGHNHHFTIDNHQFRLRANQGDPFVLLNGRLYYTSELNLDQHNYPEAKYFEIDLNEYLE